MNKIKRINRNKKGWLRVVEASIAVLILIGFSVVMVNRADTRETSLQEKVNELALEIEKNGLIREKIFTEDCDGIEQEIGNIIDNNINFAFLTSASTIECETEKPTDKEIFASSIILVKQENNYKKFTLYIWQ